MAQISEGALREVLDALTRFEEEVEATRLTPSTQNTYIVQANQFVRWLDDKFEPGVNRKLR